MNQDSSAIPVEAVQHWCAEATQRLLGDTIGISDEEWLQPTLLPGWSRAHVATHLARGADRLRELVVATIAGTPTPNEPSATERVGELEAGAQHSGLALQIDLDTTAGALQAVLDQVPTWNRVVRLRGEWRPLAAIPLCRLHELSLHHLDLNCNFAVDSIVPETAAWLLRWAIERVEVSALPPLRIESARLQLTLAQGPQPLVVSGSDARLWAWLCGRLPADQVQGAGDFRPPLT